MKCLDGEDVVEKLEKEQFLWVKARAARCPFDSLSVFGQDAYHCDLCSGHPQCVSVCTSEAIRIFPTTLAFALGVAAGRFDD
jgi:Fe-S-cluster-containing hydrogenase component 2